MAYQPDKPIPTVRCRKIDEATRIAALERGWSEVAARVIAARLDGGTHALDTLKPDLAQLDRPDGLPDIDKAADRLARAVIDGEVIGLETDHDVDGCTSHAVLLSALETFGVARTRIRSYIGHRLHDGYGLSAPLATRILVDEPRPSVIVTADNGSSDEPRIGQLAKAGIDVIVTDHHDLPEAGPPTSAYACVTPRRADNAYPDTTIAGCMVAWLLACKLRHALIRLGHEQGTQKSLGCLLDFVALGTVADCVDLGHSRNNRVVVQTGLKLIAKQRRACWQVAYERGWVSQPLSGASLGFGIGPRINARGRLSDALAGVSWLLADTREQACRYADVLDEENQARKTIERDLSEIAFVSAAKQVEDGRRAIVVWLEGGHSGVQGIVASRITEAFGRATVCLSPKHGNPELAVGSARGVAGVHIRQAFQACADAVPGLFHKFGGHPAAGGLTLDKAQVPAFAEHFEAAVTDQLGTDTMPEPVVHTDGALAASAIDWPLIAELAELEPFGQGFDQPLFELTLQVQSAKPMGDGSHWRMVLTDNHTRLDCARRSLVKGDVM